MQIDEKKIIIDMKNTGNTVSSSIPLVLKRNQKKIKKDEYVLLIGFGVGWSWAGCVWTPGESAC